MIAIPGFPNSELVECDESAAPLVVHGDMNVEMTDRLTKTIPGKIPEFLDFGGKKSRNSENEIINGSGLHSLCQRTGAVLYD